MTYVIHDTIDGTVSVETSAYLAADEILKYDGFTYEIREAEEGGFVLYHSDRSRNAYGGSKLEQTSIFSFKGERDEAEQEIFEEVIKRSTDFAVPLETYKLDDFLALCREQIAEASKPTEYGTDEESLKGWSDLLAQAEGR